MALLALRSSSSGRIDSLEAPLTYTLRLLIAAYCQNTTSQGLAEALDRFTNLAFLDLSNTLAARDKIVLERLGSSPFLQVLKLRNIHLRDEDIEILADSIGLRVRSLDIQGNHLTDHSVRILLSICIQVQSQCNGLSGDGLGSSPDSALEDWPAGFVRPDPAVLDEFTDESYNDRFVRRLTTCTVSRLPYEDLPHSGITHLYIADNNLTVEGVATLVMSQRLFVLDAGTVNTGNEVNKPRSEASPLQTAFGARRIWVPSTEQLTPVLANCGQRLTFLRVHYAIITQNAPPKDDDQALAVCELSNQTAKQEKGNSVPDEHDAPIYEMDAAPPLYELNQEATKPRYELPGDSIHVTVSPAVGKKPSFTKEESQPQPKCGGAFAPEAVETQDPYDDASPVVTATGLGPMAQAVNGINSPENSNLTGFKFAGSFNSGKSNMEMQHALIEQQRTELRSKRLKRPHGLFPGMLPNLRTIVLTDVPCFEKSRQTVVALIQFVQDCASEAELANTQSRLEPSSLREPGRSQPIRRGHSAREIFALQRLILEMAPSEPSSVSKDLHSSKYSKRTKSSTEDPDSEAFWCAAENDFTFFDDNEECGLPSIEPGCHVPYSSYDEKMTTSISPNIETPNSQRPTVEEPLVDLVQELARFRKERKAAYGDAVKRGEQYVDGYWPGEVKVVRGAYLDGKTDYYGNYFEKGGIYR